MVRVIGSQVGVPVSVLGRSKTEVRVIGSQGVQCVCVRDGHRVPGSGSQGPGEGTSMSVSGGFQCACVRGVQRQGLKP